MCKRWVAVLSLSAAVLGLTWFLLPTNARVGRAERSVSGESGAAVSFSASWDEVRLTESFIKKAGRGQAVVGVGDGFLIFRQWQSDSDLEIVRYHVDPNGKLQQSYSKKSRTEYPLETGTAAAWDGKRFVYVLCGAKCEKARYDVVRFDAHTNTWDYATHITPTSSCWDPKRSQTASYAQGAGNAVVYVDLDGTPYLYAVVGVASDQAKRAPKDEKSALLRLKLGPDIASSWEVVYEFEKCIDDGSSLAWARDCLYFLHGCDCKDNPVKAFWRFRLASGVWDLKGEVPAKAGANDGASLIWDGLGYIYAIMGGAGEHEGTKARADGKEFLRYDLVRQRWEELRDLPVPVGDYPGNRLAIIHGFLFLWQGSKDGVGIWRLKLP